MLIGMLYTLKYLNAIRIAGYLKAVYAGVIDDGTFDWKNIAYTYTPKSRMLLIYSSRSDIDIQQISLTKHYLGKKMLECTSIG